MNQDISETYALYLSFQPLCSQSVRIDVTGNFFSAKNISLPQGCSGLDVKTDSGKYCMIKQLCISFNDRDEKSMEICRVLVTVGKKGADIDFGKKISESINISGEIFFFDSDEEYEFVSSLAHGISKLEEKYNKLNKEAIFLRIDKKRLRAEKTDADGRYQSKLEECRRLRDELESYQKSYSMGVNPFSRKDTKPARRLTDILKYAFKTCPLTKYPYMVAASVKNDGIKTTLKRIKNRLSQKNRGKVLREITELSPVDAAAQRSCVFVRNIKISIIVPLYNTPIRFLKEMIKSVISQTYGNWELCLADGSDEEHSEVERTVRKLAAKDSRIKYKKLEKNLGISGNTNACLDMATGDFIGLFDHDDLLHPAALFEVMKAVCEKNADYVFTDEMVFKSPKLSNIMHLHYKSDYAPDTLRGINYICHFSVFSRELLDKTDRFRSEYDGSQDHDLILRLTSIAENVVHIPKILYFWRSHPASVASDISAKNYAIEAGRNAVRDHIASLGMKAEVLSTEACPTAYRIKYEIKAYDKVSIIIPNKNHLEDLICCINSILDKTTYPNYEIVIVDNGSDDEELFTYYDALKCDERVVICSLDIPFNYSTLNNFAAAKASGKYYILLNNDVEIITPEWIEEMLMYVQRDDVGICGAKLYYPDNTIQHAGVIIGIGGVAGHCFSGLPRNAVGYLDRLLYSQDLSAVTAACLMIKASVFEEVGGLDEEKFKIAFNDVDLCLKVRQAGYLVVWTPYAEAYHYESKSRGYEDTPEKISRFKREVAEFKKKWADILNAGDPYYNPNLTLERGDFTMK